MNKVGYFISHRCW